MLKNNTCCFFGHRKINNSSELRIKLSVLIEKLIVIEEIHTFLFGSKSEFNDLCYETVTKLKEKYPHIKRIYVRAEYPYIEQSYTDYLLDGYEDTYFLDKMVNACKASYIERNYEMIDKSRICVVYYDENYAPPRRKKNRRDLTDYQPKSGTKIAYERAVKKKLRVINILEYMAL